MDEELVEAVARGLAEHDFGPFEDDSHWLTRGDFMETYRKIARAVVPIVLEHCAHKADRHAAIFGQEPPTGERGTNIVWATAKSIAASIRGSDTQRTT